MLSTCAVVFVPYTHLLQQLVLRASRLSFVLSGRSRQSAVCQDARDFAASSVRSSNQVPDLRTDSVAARPPSEALFASTKLSPTSSSRNHLSPRCQSASSCGAWSESPLSDISNLFHPLFFPASAIHLQRSISQSLEDALPTVLRVANFRSTNTTDMNFFAPLDRFVSIVLWS